MDTIVITDNVTNGAHAINQNYAFWLLHISASMTFWETTLNITQKIHWGIPSCKNTLPQLRQIDTRTQNNTQSKWQDFHKCVYNFLLVRNEYLQLHVILRAITFENICSLWDHIIMNSYVLKPQMCTWHFFYEDIG